MHINHYHRIKSLRPEHAPRRNAEDTAAATPQESMRVLVVDRVLLLGAWDREQEQEVLDQVQHFTQESAGQLLPLVCHRQACALTLNPKPWTLNPKPNFSYSSVTARHVDATAGAAVVEDERDLLGGRRRNFCMSLRLTRLRY